MPEVWEAVELAVASLPGSVVVTSATGYLHAECTSSLMRYVDDLEVWAPPDASQLQVRSASRVGLATGRNPIAIVVPCHRVVGADGQLVGYAGGLEMKQWLLDHERAIQPRRVPSSSCSTNAPPTHEPTGIAT